MPGKKDPSVKMPTDATPLSVPVPPVETPSTSIKVDIPWRLVLPIAAFLLGGGTLAGVTTAFTGAAASPQELSAFKLEQNQQHAHINQTLEEQDKHAKVQDGRIEDIGKVVKSVQSTQLRDVARTEARRLTEKIPNRVERENTYDRLYELNLRRLERGTDPCGSISCD